MIAGRPVTRVDVQRYVDYTLRFYAWAHHARSAPVCAAPAEAACAAVMRQALARLIEEQVVLGFALRHHIALDRSDHAQVSGEIDALAEQQVGSRPLLDVLHVNRSFMRSILTRQLLVQKVEDAVSPTSTRIGPSFRVRVVTIPFTPAERGKAREAADTLAVDGSPVPAEARQMVEWQAAFRVPAPERRALEAAQRGDFVGPFRRHSSYLVAQLLAAGRHQYGRPARDALEGAYFQSWLRTEVEAARARCLDEQGKRDPCPRETINRR